MNSSHVRRCLSILFLVAFCGALGCGPQGQVAEQEEKQEKKEPIFGKMTQKIGEWDPEANRKILEEGGDKVNMVNRSLKGYSSILNEASRLQIKRSVELFRAAEGRYPKSHEEFMQKVIKANRIKLPEPVTTAEYQYDVENHELLIVEKQK